MLEGKGILKKGAGLLEGAGLLRVLDCWRRVLLDC